MEETTSNTPVSLRDFLEQRFDALDAKIDAHCEQTNEALNDHEDRLRRQERYDIKDHENRIRRLEKQSPWRTLAESITGALAAVGVYLGIK